MRISRGKLEDGDEVSVKGVEVKKWEVKEGSEMSQC